MKQLELSEAKAKFSSVVQDAQNGEETVLTKGHSHKPVAVVISYESWKGKKPRSEQLGSLKQLGHVVFTDDWYVTDEELISL
ncbi:MAG: type II toxin-antitoxin system Phd/YefM family antitoxin [Coriobacteriales bacterium]|jgi:prevent-host-death family protein|nr:type II toxin-antitoxin system Phd/YefM family antitoxin [Coriobacteriales bacterium]